MDWYYVENGKAVGPITEDSWFQLVQQGTVAPETLVWCEGMDQWKPYREAGPSPPPFPASKLASQGKPLQPGYSSCAQCGKAFPEEDMMRFESHWVCAGCKPVFLQKLREGVRMPVAVVYGGFWIRLGAKLIDGILVMIINLMIILPPFAMLGRSTTETSGLFLALQLLISNLVVPAALATFFIGKYGATPGKMACRLQVVASDGSKMGYSRAFARYSAEILSQMTVVLFFTLGFGYLIAAWDEEKRTLHDRICDTRVIRNT